MVRAISAVCLAILLSGGCAEESANRVEASGAIGGRLGASPAPPHEAAGTAEAASARASAPAYGAKAAPGPTPGSVGPVGELAAAPTLPDAEALDTANGAQVVITHQDALVPPPDVALAPSAALPPLGVGVGALPGGQLLGGNNSFLHNPGLLLGSPHSVVNSPAVLSGAAPSAPKDGLPKRAGANGRYEVVRVFFGTDRGVSVDAHGQPLFTSNHAQTVSFGSVDVSIPRDHSTGHIESPTVLRMEFQRDPSRDVTILKVAVAPYEQFRAEMRSKALNASTPSVLLFIHGYNVSFEDAAMRTAQMAYDLDFAGAPVLFSWPSRGQLVGYFEDEQAIEQAQGDIEQFVTEVLAASPGAYLYVVAHSMGNRGMTRALVSFAHDHPEEASRIREVVLAAPDIDTDVFLHQIAPNLVAVGAPVTLYASSTDHALRISEMIHGGPRAGDSGQNLVLLKGIETIDVTNIDTDLTGHSYVGDRRSILSDLYYIIRSDMRANQRFGLSQKTRNGSAYWVFNR